MLYLARAHLVHARWSRSAVNILADRRQVVVLLSPSPRRYESLMSRLTTLRHVRTNAVDFWKLELGLAIVSI